jgi:hypothetical protein
MTLKTKPTRTRQQWRSYLELEFQQSPSVVRPAKQSIGQKIAAAFRQMQHSLQTFSFFQQEPDIQERVDNQGNVQWQVYDPLNDSILDFDSQSDLLSWLEERHHSPARFSAFFYN